MSDSNASIPQDAVRELTALRRKVASLERNNKLLSIASANAERLRAFNEQEKNLQYLYNDLLLKHAPNMIFLFNEELRLALCTEACVGFLRFKSSAEMLNLPLQSVFSNKLHNEWIGKVSEECRECMEKRASMQYNDQISFTVGDSHMDAQIALSPIINEEDECRGVVMAITDTSELSRMKEKAEAAAKSKSSFLANMSHEIRTPMNAVKGLSELLLLSPLSQVQRDYVRNIVASSNSLLHIINDVLDFSKIDANKMEILKADYSLSDLISEVSSVVNLRASEKGLTLLIDIDPTLPRTMNGDDIRIKQIVLNLLSNAVKYTQEGFVKLGVHGEYQNGVIHLRFSVEDSGTGISEEELPLLFEAFQRADMRANRAITGTGLGLAIAQRLAEAMHGTINVTSEYGKGSCFSFSLPQDIVDPTPLVLLDNQVRQKVLVFERGISASNIRQMLGYLRIPGIFCEDTAMLKIFSEKQKNEFTHCLCHEDLSQTVIAECKKLMPHCIFIVIKDMRQVLELSAKADITLFEPLLVTDLAKALTRRGNETEQEFESEESVKDGFMLIGARALIVDDNAINLLVGGELLRSYNLEVEAVDSGLEAIKACKASKFDIIFMDHMMPGMDGIEAAQHIRADENLNKETPIIALTANVADRMQEEYLKNGMNDFISKPIEMAEMSRVLKAWIPSGRIVYKNAADKPVEQSTMPEVTRMDTSVVSGQESFDLFSLLDAFGMYASDVLREIGGDRKEYISRLEHASRVLDELTLRLIAAEKAGHWLVFTSGMKTLRKVLYDIGARSYAGRIRNLELAARGKEKLEIHSEFISLMDDIRLLDKKLAVLVPAAQGENDHFPFNDPKFLKESFKELQEALDTPNLHRAFALVDLLSCSPFERVIGNQLYRLRELLGAGNISEALEECTRVRRVIS